MKFRALLIALVVSTSCYATSEMPGFSSGGHDPKEDLLRDLIRGGNSEQDMRDRLNDLLRQEGKHPLSYENGDNDAPIDATKGCISHTTCTGTGKEKTCETWSLCVSN